MYIKQCETYRSKIKLEILMAVRSRGREREKEGERGRGRETERERDREEREGEERERERERRGEAGGGQICQTQSWKLTVQSWKLAPREPSGILQSYHPLSLAGCIVHCTAQLMPTSSLAAPYFIIFIHSVAIFILKGYHGSSKNPRMHRTTMCF